MKVRAKFRVDAVTEFQNDQGEVKLSATNQKDGDNQDWSKWTPSGELRMSITNPAALMQFVPGQVLWVDLSDVEVAAPVLTPETPTKPT